MNLLGNIFSIYDDKAYKVICLFGLKLKIKNRKAEIKLLKKEFNKKIKDMERSYNFKLMKLLPVKSIKTIEMHIVDHCNLNCKGCFHFAPLAPQSFLSLSEFESDLKRLSELTKGEIENFNILGGEPLLHPQYS